MFDNAKRTTLLQLERIFDVDCITENDFNDAVDGADRESRGGGVGQISIWKPHFSPLQPASPFVTDIEF
jgi:hypothetical protein